MADHNEIPRHKTPGEQQYRDFDCGGNNHAQTKHIEHQVNDHNSTIDLLLRTTTTKSLAPSLLSPFSPSNTELVGHDYVRSLKPATPIARGPKFERAAARARETTMHLAQIVRMDSADVDKEKGEINIEAVAELKSQTFRYGLKTLNKEYSDDRNLKVDAWMERFFQQCDSAVAVTAPGPGEHSTPIHINSSTLLRTPRQAINSPASPSTVVPATVRRVRGFDDLRTASEET
ncbi:hypothetical protein KCU65_g5669, partial [Aureobasidium melanogenum]